MRRLSSLLAGAAAAVLLLTACSPAQPADGTSSAGADTLVDCAGRTVTLPEQRDTIACLYAYTGHVAVLLGCEDRVAAVVDGLKRDELMQIKIPDIDNMACPYTSGSINIEELAAVSPDLIFLRASNLQDEGEMEKLTSLGIPAVVVEYVTMEDQINSISVMGQALDCQERADAYLDYYRSTIQMVKDRLAQLPEEDKLTVYHSVNEVVRTDIPQTLSYEVLEAAGCINVVTDTQELQVDGEKGYVTVEQIYVWDPDVVLANEPSAVEYFKTDNKFSGLRAVREGNVFQLPVGMSRWAHPGSLESPLAVLYLASTLYPEYFTDINIQDEIRSFYHDFFTLDLTDDQIADILSGEGMRAPREEAAA